MESNWWLRNPVHLWCSLPKHFKRGFGLGLSFRLESFGWAQVKLMSGFQLLFFLAIHLLTALL